MFDDRIIVFIKLSDMVFRLFFVKSLSISVTQADMLTQEANYKQIQDAKAMVEDDLQHKLEEFEEERERLLKLANTASSLERDLEQVLKAT